MTPTPSEHDFQLQDILAQFYDDPLGYVMFAFPWEEEPAIQLVKLPEKYHDRFPGCTWGPDLWACEFLDELGSEIRKRGFDGKTAVDPIQFATVSGHGIGKSTITAWIIKFIMDTRPYCKGRVTSGKAEQLKSNTWAELGKWHRMSVTEHWFKFTSGRGAMALVSKKYPEWKVEAYTSKEENADSFAGLHAANSTPFYIFDEGSAVPDAIYEVREGGTTDGEPMVFDFGNGTRNSGRFYEECEGRFKKRFIVRHIDSRSVAITNKKRIQQWLEDFGEDSDFFRVRVRGMFPKQGSVQFIATADVEAAMQREIVNDPRAPLIIGVDVARFGNNASVIFPRIGMDARSFPRKRFMGLDTWQLAGKVAEEIRFFESLGKRVSGLFVDEGGVGGGVVDNLRHMGYPVIGVNFGGKPTDSNMYRFKSDEMWGRMRDAIRSRLCLPQDPGEALIGNLKSQLTGREYGFTLLGNQIHLETKKDMEERGLESPDDADALALTFAQDIAAEVVSQSFNDRPLRANSEYDPLERF